MRRVSRMSAHVCSIFDEQSCILLFMVKDGALSDPIVSVVVPTCDRREKICTCVQSLLIQTVEAIEIIVVDDGSRDGTIEALQEIQDPRFTLLCNEQNMGANASRNKGSQHARADLVAFLDSDCIAAPDWVERFIPVFDDVQIGAASGLVEDSPITNVWELMFSGTHRFDRPGPISRITSCNLCVRRALLLGHKWEEDFSDNAVDAEGATDTSFSGRCDEEGLYLAMQAAGWKMVAEPTAMVEHVHPYDRRSLIRQAFYGGGAAAELVWKFRLRDRTDLIFLALAYFTLIPAVVLGALFSWWYLLVPGVCLLLQSAAVGYNECMRKGKSLLQLMKITPVLVLYYHLRLAGYLRRRVQLILGVDSVEREDSSSIGRGMPKPPAEAGGHRDRT